MLCAEIELGVICVGLEGRTMAVNYFTKWDHVNYKEKGAKHRAFVNTLADSGKGRSASTIGHKLFLVSEVRLESGEGCVSKANKVRQIGEEKFEG